MCINDNDINDINSNDIINENDNIVILMCVLMILMKMCVIIILMKYSNEMIMKCNVWKYYYYY